MRSRSPLLLLCLLVLGLAACEVQLDAPSAALTMETRSAAAVLPADAPFVAMTNLREMQTNPALDPFRDDALAVGQVGAEIAARIEAFLDATGFDPARDLHEVYVAGVPGAGHQEAVLVAYADYDRDRFLAEIDAQLGDALARTDYDGVPVYRSLDARGDVHFALANDDMLLAAGNAADLHAMLDRLADGGPALADDDDMMARIQRVSDGTAWVVTRGMALDRQHDDGAHDTHLPRLDQVVGDVAAAFQIHRDGLDARVALTPTGDVSPEEVADLLRGALAVMKADGRMDAAKRRALDDARIRAEGDHVQVTFRLDNALIASER